jgi:hypothetical protein
MFTGEFIYLNNSLLLLSIFAMYNHYIPRRLAFGQGVWLDSVKNHGRHTSLPIFIYLHWSFLQQYY